MSIDHPQLAGPEPAPDYLSELARLKEAFAKAAGAPQEFARPEVRAVLNPTLELIELSWKHLTPLLSDENDSTAAPPDPGNEWVVIFRGPSSRKMRCRPATNHELLALKVVAGEFDAEQVAREHGVPMGVIVRAVSEADRMGLVLAPESKIVRNPAFFTGREQLARFQAASVFTLQWHLTQACDLHCRHCYDRSSRKELDLRQGLSVLDDLHAFCRARQVDGHVSFSGGNPLMYPHLDELYQRAVDLGFTVAILGNPTSIERLQKLVDIQPPEFFQVSLEGLREHNDLIRGPGHFERVMEFLAILKESGVYSMVMLTLTRANQEQVLPLAELLRDKAALFTFNRLSLEGEGAQLMAASREGFEEFLREYALAAKENPIMNLKDNFFNILRYQEGESLLGGCAGYGCGAGFNFLSLLSDGEVHACRKFPSLIGDIHQQGLAEIYDSPLAEQYRNGPTACRECPIRPACGGCLAVAKGGGRDIFQEPDPYCFMSQS